MFSVPFEGKYLICNYQVNWLGGERVVNIEVKTMNSGFSTVGCVVFFSGSGNLVLWNNSSDEILLQEGCLLLPVKYLIPSLEQCLCGTESAEVCYSDEVCHKSTSWNSILLRTSHHLGFLRAEYPFIPSKEWTILVRPLLAEVFITFLTMFFILGWGLDCEI